MNKLTVLMYHAIGDPGIRTGDEDPHYTVSRNAFRGHLARIRSSGFTASSVDRIMDGDTDRKVALTFDDGHESNGAAALEILEHGGSADLFVNPTTVGQAGFLDWQSLADLTRAGISVQSHGHSHRYFDELDDTEVERELAISKAAIEDHTGHAVTLFAPPGGRLNPRVAGIARKLGYRAICSSRAGLWRPDGDPWRIPRLAVLAGTPEAQFNRWIEQDSLEFTRMAARDRILTLAKRALGNAGYERLRNRLLGQSKAGTTP